MGPAYELGFMLTLGIGWEIEAILQTCKVGPHFQSLEKSVLNAPFLTGTLKLDSILPTIRCGQLADSNLLVILLDFIWFQRDWHIAILLE